MLICDKCGASISDDSKFCPQCGDPVTEDDIVHEGLKQQVPSVEITFGYSSSSNYKRALELCGNIPTFTTSGEEKTKIHKVTLAMTDVDLVSNIFDIVGNWKTSKMLINGKKKTKRDLVYFGVGCYKEWREVKDKDSYCHGTYEYERNIWGCKKLEMPIYEWGGGWLEYGAFDDTGVWHFDKVKIKKELERAMQKVELCPVLDRQKVYGALDLIPDIIDPNTTDRWEYDKRVEYTNGKYVEMAKGVKPVIHKMNHYIFSEQKPYWKNTEEESNNTQEIVINLKMGEEKPVASLSTLFGAMINIVGGLFVMWILFKFITR